MYNGKMKPYHNVDIFVDINYIHIDYYKYKLLNMKMIY